MPPRESTRPARTNVYSVLLVVSAAFLALAIIITWVELKSDYDFMGTAEYGAVADGEEMMDEGVTDDGGTVEEEAAPE